MCELQVSKLKSFKAIVLGHMWKKSVLCLYLDKQTKLCCEIYPNLCYTRNLHLAPKFEKNYFYTTENFGVKK